MLLVHHTLLVATESHVIILSGTAMRYCNSEGQWEEANVLQCTTLEFIGLEQLVRYMQ